MRLLLVGDELLVSGVPRALEQAGVEVAWVEGAGDVTAELSSGDGDAVLLPVGGLHELLDLEFARRPVVQDACRGIISAMATALDAKDKCGPGHSQRVQRFALELADAIRPELAADPSAQYGFLLHDVGTLEIPDSVLLKPDVLSREEWALVKTHPIVGERLLSEVSLLAGEGLKVVRSHHERWDGRGYPDKRAGLEIPLSARIFALADTLDALTSARPYRRVRAWNSAREKIVSQSARQFDPDVVAAFLEREPRLRAIARANGNPDA